MVEALLKIGVDTSLMNEFNRNALMEAEEFDKFNIAVLKYDYRRKCLHPSPSPTSKS